MWHMQKIETDLVFTNWLNSDLEERNQRYLQSNEILSSVMCVINVICIHQLVYQTGEAKLGTEMHLS